MAKYTCNICGFVYDEVKGYAEGNIAPNTKWEDIPDDWICPLCGATKNDFSPQGDVLKKPTMTLSSVEDETEELRELSFGELSALCSNLSKGCEKQYRIEEASLFSELAEYYGKKTSPITNPKLSDLLELIEQDLSYDYEKANLCAINAHDRGALRALTWSEKVTRILSSLISRYEIQKDSILEHTNIYVCEICGFVYIGDDAPDICPICKVPSMKITKILKGVV